mmetsp:Transcript_37139/g.69105  ORF Transcript_37139/g.69105 Transcript_37139/m.69105 type:complete len:446 (+) Transcript_37139:63-1400(+)
MSQSLSVLWLTCLLCLLSVTNSRLSEQPLRHPSRTSQLIVPPDSLSRGFKSHSMGEGDGTPDAPSGSPTQQPSQLSSGQQSPYPTVTARPSASPLSPTQAPTTPEPSASPTTPAPTRLPDTIKEITINMTQGLSLACLIEDCQDPSWGLNNTNEENIFQVCRVLALVFADCSFSDQQSANTSCSVMARTQSSGGEVQSFAQGRTMCSEGCYGNWSESNTTDADAVWGQMWCQYISIYYVFCISSDAALPPGTTLEGMQAVVGELSSSCQDAWSGRNGTHGGGGDDHHYISAGSDKAVGGGWSPIIVAGSALALFAIGYFVIHKLNWCRSGRFDKRGLALSSFDDDDFGHLGSDSLNCGPGVRQSPSTNLDFIDAVMDDDGPEEGSSSVMSVTKRRLSRIRKASVDKAVELGAGGVAVTANTFSKVMALYDDDNEDEDEELAEIIL